MTTTRPNHKSYASILVPRIGIIKTYFFLLHFCCGHNSSPRRHSSNFHVAEIFVCPGAFWEHVHPYCLTWWYKSPRQQRTHIGYSFLLLWPPCLQFNDSSRFHGYTVIMTSVLLQAGQLNLKCCAIKWLPEVLRQFWQQSDCFTSHIKQKKAGPLKGEFI